VKQDRALPHAAYQRFNHYLHHVWSGVRFAAVSNAEANSTWMDAPAYSGVRLRQISTLWNDPCSPYIGLPIYALDNNTNGNYYSGVPPAPPCSHTDRPEPRLEPWWPWTVVDLGATVPANSKLVSVRLWNRDDCCSGEVVWGWCCCNQGDPCGHNHFQLTPPALLTAGHATALVHITACTQAEDTTSGACPSHCKPTHALQQVLPRGC
jgi:hypothetical protein